MASKAREPFDWMGLLFLIDVGLLFILFFGSIFGSLSTAGFYIVAIAATAVCGATCGISWRKVWTDPSRNWKPARFITGATTIALLALIYISLR